MTPEEVRERLMITAEPLGWPAAQQGAGLVNAEGAVFYVPPSPAPPRYTISPKGTLSITWGELKR